MLKKRNLGLEPQKSRSFRSFFFISILLFSFSCKKGLQPDSPVEAYIQEIEQIERTISYINIPIEIPIQEIEKQINSNLENTLYNDDSFENDDLKLKIDKKGSFAITKATNDDFSFEIPLSIEATKVISVLGFKKAAGTKFEMIAKFSSKFFLNTNWQVNTNTKVEGFEFLTQPKISLGGFEVPIKPIIEKVLTNYQPFIARQIDEQVANSIEIKPQILELWNSLKQPIKVSDAYNTWMIIDPQDMLISPILTKVNKINLNIAMKAYVDTYTGETKFAKPKQSVDLPPLKFISNAPSGFKINVSNLLTFSEAQSLAKSMFLGQVFSFSNNKYNVKVEGIDLFGTTENQMVIKLQLSGSLDGTVFLKGNPVFDKKTNTIQFDNLNFDIKTKNVLLKSASWVLQGKLEKEIAKEMVFSVDEVLKEIESSVAESLAKEYIKGVKIETSMLRMVPKDVIMTKEGLLSNFTTVGEIKLKIQSL